MTVNTGKLLRINLSAGEISEDMVPEKISEDFIGGRGYGIKYLYDEIAPGIDPLGEDNKLIILTGPLSGSSVQAASRWMVCTKSPLTGVFARSVGGADFGAWMKFAGYELIIIEGKAERPSYIHIGPDGTSIRDAGEIWGSETKEAQEWLKKNHGNNTRVVCIGPAGEKLVRYSAIVSDRRTAGRCGTGAVMGSKNIKAVAVTANRNLTLSDPDRLNSLAKEQIRLLQQSQGFANHKEWGTTNTQEVTNSMGIYPVMNFRYGQQTGYEKFIGTEYRKLRTGDFGCYGCPARCGKAHLVQNGPFKGAYSEGPEYESIWAFTGPIDSTSIEATVMADQLCDDLGLDTISAGSVIGFAYELFEKGLLTRADTDGMVLEYGDPAPMIELIRKIARREGIGDLLAEGSKRAAAAIGKGAEVCAIHVKGLELPAYEPRGAKTHGYNYVTSSIGASHCYGYAGQDIFGAVEPRPSDRFAEAENADLVIFNQNGAAMRELGIACNFSAGWGWIHLFPEMLAAARGIGELEDMEYVKKAGDRIYNLERAFNIRQGTGRKDDTMPVRMLTEPLHTRQALGEGQMIREQDAFLDNYYSLRGWTKEGIPSKKKLEELGLGYVSADMPG